ERERIARGECAGGRSITRGQVQVRFPASATVQDFHGTRARNATSRNCGGLFPRPTELLAFLGGWWEGKQLSGGKPVVPICRSARKPARRGGGSPRLASCRRETDATVLSSAPARTSAAG